MPDLLRKLLLLLPHKFGIALITATTGAAGLTAQTRRFWRRRRGQRSALGLTRRRHHAQDFVQ